MKKHLIKILLLVLVFTSCEPNKIGDFDESKVPGYVIDDAINKKGVAFTSRSLDWSHKTSALGAHWMYSWGNELREEIPENVEFVPMFWGKGSVNDANINRVKQLVAEGKVKYILGFNEPDGAAQANMTVDEAIALWPRLEEIGVPIGSPATVSPNNAWMIEFMQKVEANNLRVDFVAVHHYGGPNVMAMVNKLKETYAAYKRPIWITEFAVADWGAASPAANRYTVAEVIEYMNQGLKALDEIEWVERYAWFSGTQAPLFTSALFDDDAVITEAGQVYAGHTPNPTIGPGKDTSFTPTVDPDELVVNGGFETGMVAPWGGFKNGVSTNDPRTGGFCGQLQNHDASLFTVVDVIPGKTYLIKYSARWASVPTNTFSPGLRIEGVGGAPGLIKQLEPLEQTDQWTDYSNEVVIPDGVTKMRFVFFKGQVNPQYPPAFIDDISVKEK
ncbi:MAG: glycosyl hydrolase [Polaribacter sp.]|uniref:glycosyl hydrolase n=1 Tax=Polaribacter sp. TaxID=1920175 RepID=UPI003BB19118